MSVTGKNIARHLRSAAIDQPDALATKSPLSVSPSGAVTHAHSTFLELDRESDAAARLFQDAGISQGTRTLLAVKPGHDLIVGMFGLIKLGAIPVAIDPGMGWATYLKCVKHSQPTAVVGIRRATLLSRFPLAAFASIRNRITIGTAHWKNRLARQMSANPFPISEVQADDLAAILFTSGSTGTPKGVRYTHGMFEAQIRLIRETYGVQSGEVDMPMLPLFALFNPALGMTTVTPLLDPARPASANPAPIVSALLAEKVTNSFGSPAIWSRITEYCQRKGIKLPSLRRLLIAGAPVPDGLLEQLRTIAPQCKIHTPYGATECLPVTSIESEELLGPLRQLTLSGRGTCVGRPVAGVEIRVIHETESALNDYTEAKMCAPGEVGEIIATGPSVTQEYDNLPTATRLAKIREGNRLWHRMGDLGSLDADGRLFFLGRKVEKVRHAGGDLYTEAVEPTFRAHPWVARCALIGIGSNPQTAALVIEPRTGNFPPDTAAQKAFVLSLRACAQRNPAAAAVEIFVFQKNLPVDVRHNAKIHRLQLAREWSERLLHRAPMKSGKPLSP